MGARGFWKLPGQVKVMDRWFLMTVLSLWVATPLGVKRSFHRGCLKVGGHCNIRNL